MPGIENRSSGPCVTGVWRAARPMSTRASVAGGRISVTRRPSLEPVEQGLGLEQVDPALDEVDDGLDLGLLLDLLLDEPLQELVTAMIAGLEGDRRHAIELDRH